MHPLFHPLSDPQQTPAVGLCSLCGGELYPGDDAWQINQLLICGECLGAFARLAFAPHHRICGRKEEHL